MNHFADICISTSGCFLEKIRFQNLWEFC